MSLKRYSKLSFGNIIEWYDFSLYIYFACFIAGDFFPSNNPQVKLILAYSAFFIGSLARPLGGIVSGWLGDLFNTAVVVNYCVIVMGVSTLLMAFLPDYHQIGIFAPILLTLLRFIQGLSAGGQMPNLITLSADNYQQQSGVAIGMSFSISSIGFLLASLLGFILTQYFCNFSTQVLWRFAFASSAFLLLGYLLLNRKTTFTINKSPPTQKSSLINAMKHQRLAIFVVVLLTMMCSSLYYLIFTYLITYQIEVLKYPQEQAFILNSGILVIACVAYPLFGYFADKIGNSILYWCAVACLSLILIPSFEIIQNPQAQNSFLAIALLAIAIAAIQAGVSPLFAKLFEPQWRATGCAFSYSVGNALGGAAPLVALNLVNITPHYGLIIMTSSLLLLGCLGMYLAKTTQKRTMVIPT